MNTASCNLSGTNGDLWTGLASSGNAGQVSSPINEQTVYTLTCTGLDNSMFRQSATVNVIPRFKEQ